MADTPAFLTFPGELGHVRYSEGVHVAQQRVHLQVSRRTWKHFHADVGWVFAGGRLEVAVGASSRDLRLRAVVEVPGEDVRVPLAVWSTLGEWFADPLAGAASRS